MTACNLQWVKERCRVDVDCWLWGMSTSRNGLPRYTVKMPGGATKSMQIRRMAWEFAYGSIPDGMRVSVTCGCKLCVNPKHLHLNTPGAINRRTAARPEVRAKRFASALPRRYQHAKLDWEKARHIRESDTPAYKLAAEFGVAASLVGRVRRGECWRESVNVNGPFAGLVRG